VPDLFAGDAVSVEEQEAGLNLTEWLTQHPPSEIERIITTTVQYARGDLGFSRVGAVGYCFGGKYVSRYLAAGRGIDAGFVAHPSNLLEDEIRAVAGPLSIAAGSEFPFYLHHARLGLPGQESRGPVELTLCHSARCVV
jgi:dienelactone hydrolase